MIIYYVYLPLINMENFLLKHKAEVWEDLMGFKLENQFFGCFLRREIEEFIKDIFTFNIKYVSSFY